MRAATKATTGETLGTWALGDGGFSSARAARPEARPKVRTNPGKIFPATWAQACEAFVRLFLPRLEGDPKAYDKRLFVQPARYPRTGHPWRWVRLSRRVSAGDAVRTHLAIGGLGEALPLGDREQEIRAIGVQYLPGERVSYLNVDLDGGYDPRAVISALARVGVEPLIVGSSSRPGRYRAIVLLSRPMRVDELQRAGARLFAGLGFPLRRGSIELYPSTTSGRLPFGLGGCVRFDPDLVRGEREHPIALMRRLFAAPRIDLHELAVRHGAPEADRALAFPPHEIRIEPVQKARGGGDELPGDPSQRPSREPSRKSPPRRVASRSPAHVRALLEHRVPDVARHVAIHVGARSRPWADTAVETLIRDAFYRGMTPARAVKLVQEWIREEGGSALRRQLRDVPRRVEGLFATLPALASAGPANLSASDVQEIAPYVQRAAKVTGLSEARIGAFVLAILPRFKGARVSGRVDEQERPEARIHVRDWRAAGGKAYRVIRDALGCFEPTSGYLPARAAADPALAHATRYALTGIALSADTPAHPLARTWALIVHRAERAQRMRSKRERVDLETQATVPPFPRTCDRVREADRREGQTTYRGETIGRDEEGDRSVGVEAERSESEEGARRASRLPSARAHDLRADVQAMRRAGEEHPSEDGGRGARASFARVARPKQGGPEAQAVSSDTRRGTPWQDVPLGGRVAGAR